MAQRRKYRTDQWMVPGHEEAARRLNKHDGRVFPAFNSLDIFSATDAENYMDEPLDKILKHPDPAASRRGQLFGLMLAFAITAVEADRERRGS